MQVPGPSRLAVRCCRRHRCVAPMYSSSARSAVRCSIAGSNGLYRFPYPQLSACHFSRPEAKLASRSAGAHAAGRGHSLSTPSA